jgi:hypothetical protein
MVKRKSRAQISVADGAGSMIQLADRRFEERDGQCSSWLPATKRQLGCDT